MSPRSSGRQANDYLTINSNEQNNDKEHDEAPQFDELN